MFKEKKDKTVELTGVVKVKYINSPEHFNKLAREASSLFEDSSDISPIVAKILLGEFKEGKDTIPAEFSEKTASFFRKVFFSTSMAFIPAKTTFKVNDEFKIIHDVLAELTVRNGIVEKISSGHWAEE